MLYCDEEKFDEMCDRILGIAGLLSEEIEVPIIINQMTVKEALLQTKESLLFYGMDVNSVSVYKEAGHIAFWINKLKPARLISSLQSTEIVKRAFSSIGDNLFGTEARYENADIMKKIDESIIAAKVKEIRLAEKYDYPVNEHLALMTAVRIIQGHQERAAKNLEEPAATDYENQMKNGDKRIMANYWDLVHSLRYFNYSARGLAVLIESVSKTTHE